MRTIILTAALGVLAFSPASAQKPQKGTWELGAFGRYNWYDNAFNQIDSTKGKNSWGLGGRLGYFFSPRFSLEVDGSGNPTDLDQPSTGAQSVGLIYQPYHLRGLYHAPLSERFSWLLGVGLNYNRYRVSSEADAFLEKRFEGDDFGIGGLTGFRYKLTDAISARLDGTLDLIPSPENDDNSNTMAGAQLGLSVFLGGGCRDRIDSIRVEPRNQTIRVGDRATLRVSGYECDGDVVDASGTSTGRVATGQGSLAGMTFTGTQTGCSDIEVTNASARRKKTDTARICVEAPPPVTPRVTLDRCEVIPATAEVFAGESVTFRVVGHYSDGSSRDLDAATLNADAGTVTGRSFRAPGAGGPFTITAQCGDGRSARATVTLRRINITLRALFEFNRTTVYVQAEQDSLRSLAEILKQYPSVNLTLYGHTDWVGSVGYNERLGNRRVQAVLDTLAAYGIDRARMEGWTKASYGECQPVDDNGTNRGRGMNRRVEIFDTPSAKRYEGSAQCRERP